jgi:D-3-phosphoglycerate dehydrogenase
VAERAAGFQMDLVGFDPYVDAEQMAEWDVEKADLDELCREADVVTVHTPVTDATRGLIGVEEFDLMADSAYFINTARGAIIDQDALLAELEAGTLRGAVLELANVVTTPHLAGAAEEVIDRHSRMVTDDIEAILNGGTPEYVANDQALTPEASGGGD